MVQIATPQMILNFATFLEENKYFEEAFRVYEKVRGRHKRCLQSTWP